MLCNWPTRADELESIRQRGSVTCGVLGNAEPFGYQDPATRQLAGFEVDLCRDLAKSLGATADLKVISPQARIPELLQGRIDVLAALITYTPERAQQVDFSTAYAVDTFRCMVRKNFGINTLDDLKEKRIAVQVGGPTEAVLHKLYPSATILSFDDASAKFLALMQGKVAANCDRTILLRGLQLRTANPDATEILPQPLPVVQKAAFAVRKGNEAFVAYLDRFLSGYEQSGEGPALFDKWLGRNSKYELPRDYHFGDPVTD